MAKRSNILLAIVIIYLATIEVEGKKWKKEKDKGKGKGKQQEDDCRCERYDSCEDQCCDSCSGYGRRSSCYGGGRRGGRYNRRHRCRHHQRNYCCEDYDDCDYDPCYCERDSGKKGGKKEDKFWDSMMKKDKDKKNKNKGKGKDKNKGKRKDKKSYNNYRNECCNDCSNDDYCCEPSYFEDECCGGGDSQTIVVKNGPAIIQTVIVDDEVYSKYCRGYYDQNNPLQRVYVQDDDCECSRSEPTYPSCEEECEPQTYRVVVRDPGSRKSYNQYSPYSSYCNSY